MTSQPARQTFDRPLWGIGCKLAASVLFAVMFAAIRWLGTSFPVGEIGLSRSALYGALFALAGAGLQGMAMVLIRRMSAHEHSITIAFYFMLTSAAVSVLTVGFGWRWPAWPEAAVLLITGLAGGIGQIF